MTLALHDASLIILALAAVLVLVRVGRGPSVFDRAMGLETLTLVMVAALLLYGDLTVDAAMGLALFAFVTTVLLARFLGRGEFRRE